MTTGKERAFQFQSHGFKRHLGRGNPKEPEQGLDGQLHCNPWGVVKGRAASLLLSEVGLGGPSASHDATWTPPATGESARSNSARSWNLALGLAERRHWQKREHCLRSQRTQDKMGERFSIFLKFPEVGRQEESRTLGKNNLSPASMGQGGSVQRDSSSHRAALRIERYCAEKCFVDPPSPDWRCYEARSLNATGIETPGGQPRPFPGPWHMAGATQMNMDSQESGLKPLPCLHICLFLFFPERLPSLASQGHMEENIDANSFQGLCLPCRCTKSISQGRTLIGSAWIPCSLLDQSKKTSKSGSYL